MPFSVPLLFLSTILNLFLSSVLFIITRSLSLSIPLSCKASLPPLSVCLGICLCFIQRSLYLSVCSPAFSFSPFGPLCQFHRPSLLSKQSCIGTPEEIWVKVLQCLEYFFVAKSRACARGGASASGRNAWTARGESSSSYFSGAESVASTAFLYIRPSLLFQQLFRVWSSAPFKTRRRRHRRRSWLPHVVGLQQRSDDDGDVVDDDDVGVEFSVNHRNSNRDTDLKSQPEHSHRI